MFDQNIFKTITLLSNVMLLKYIKVFEEFTVKRIT